MKRLYISFKSLVNDFVYSFGRAALLLLVEVYNHTVPVRERGRIRVKSVRTKFLPVCVTLLSSQLYFGTRTALREGSVRTLRTAVFPYATHTGVFFLLNFMNLRETCN
jgi:hypothetical protein